MTVIALIISLLFEMTRGVGCHDSVAIPLSIRHELMHLASSKYDVLVGSPSTPDRIQTMIGEPIGQDNKSSSMHRDSSCCIPQEGSRCYVEIDISKTTCPSINHRRRLLSSRTSSTEVERQLFLVVCVES